MHTLIVFLHGCLGFMLLLVVSMSVFVSISQVIGVVLRQSRDWLERLWYLKFFIFRSRNLHFIHTVLFLIIIQSKKNWGPSIWTGAMLVVAGFVDDRVWFDWHSTAESWAGGWRPRGHKISRLSPETSAWHRSTLRQLSLLFILWFH